MRALFISACLTACSFDGSTNLESSAQEKDAAALIDADLADAALVDATSTSWWDPSYTQRARITVRTGAQSPAKGYAGYTVQLSVDTAGLIGAGKLRSDCADLRILFWDGAQWQERSRHLIDCNSTTSDLRFAVQEDIAANGADDRYFLYYGNAAATAPAALTPTDVYLWHDDALVDRLADYDTGRLDTWGTTNTWAQNTNWNAAGYYEYQTADDNVSSFRRAVDERDVYVEVELFHTDCFPNNMATGLVLRGIIAAGTGATETADHYYLSQRGHQEECSTGYAFDGDVIKTVRGTIAVDGPDPPAIPRSQWRKQGLATSGINPTQISFWDNDSGWPSLGWPSSSLWVSNSDADDYEGAGFAGLWIAQDSGRFRGMLIRRYVDPEPVATVGAESSAP